MQLDGRTAVVIGAGSGVGRGIAHALCVAGMRVVAADIDERAARTTSETATGPGTVSAFPVDATDPGSLRDLAVAAVPEGALDLLVVTVGVLDMLPVDEITEAHWQWAWDLNVMASVRAVDVFLPSLRRGAPSGIVLTGSGSGLQVLDPDPLSALYATTKHALTGYAGVLRTALAPEGIDVVLLVPSGVEGNLALTSHRSRAAYLGTDDGAVRGEQPPGRVLVPASQIGELLVDGLRRGSPFVNNRGDVFHDAMAEWLDGWQRSTGTPAASPSAPE